MAKLTAAPFPATPLGAALLANGKITPEALARAEEAAAASEVRLSAALTRLGLLSEHDLATTFTDLLGIARLPAAGLASATSVPHGLNPAYLRARKIIPLDVDDPRPRLVMADPLDEETISAMRFALNREIDPMVAGESEIEEALDRAIGAGTILPEATPAPIDTSDLTLLNDSESDAPIIRQVNRLIAKAVAMSASDIHLEPQPEALSVRFRVDGNLCAEEKHPARSICPLTSRVKLMAGLDIAEQRLPQDGRIRASVRGNPVDLRIATFPTLHGESVVMRILGQRSVELDLARIGLVDPGLSDIDSALANPHGLILITGPTGSGKTTTLYAALNRLRSPEKKVVTVEDPIEYTLPGISQLQVKPEIGLTYAAALRSVLRNDPDVIMVGEIRDRETADIAIRAALTGHLVLATLHTNTAAGAITRLLDLGIEDYLIASVLLLTSAQRLVRRVCGDCARWRAVSAEERLILQQRNPTVRGVEQVREYHGCPNCRGEGFSGRIPIFESVRMSDRLGTMIRAGFDEAAFNDVARADGSASLFDDGMERVRRGLTTIVEVLGAVGTC